MRGNELLEKMNLIDCQYIEEADNTPKRKIHLRWIAVAACLCLIVGACALLFRPQEETPMDPVYSDRTTVTINYNYEGEIPDPKSVLQYFTEEEMFAMDNHLIFRGVVTNLQNISIDFNGRLEIRCIATIQISKVIRGDLQAGHKIQVVLPCGLDFQREDTGIIRQIRVGMEGIFMPIRYDENSYMEMNGDVLMCQDLAPCGLGDGVRWVFLKKDQGGLIFARSAYPGAKDASTLEEIEEYIAKMLQ